jgi:hypothetical protein
MPEGVDVARIINELPMEFLKGLQNEAEGPSMVEDINAYAFGLALFGWRADNEYMDGMASCDACFRRLGLWLFRGNDNSDVQVSDDPDAITPVISKLDVAQQHREYCPWVNSLSQNGTEDPKGPWEGAGWEVLVHALNGTYQAQAPSPKPSTDHSAEAQELALPSEAYDASSVRGQAPSSIGEISVAESRDAKDKERWAKLKKLKKVFDIKPSRTKTAAVK